MGLVKAHPQAKVIQNRESLNWTQIAQRVDQYYTVQLQQKVLLCIWLVPSFWKLIKGFAKTDRQLSWFDLESLSFNLGFWSIFWTSDACSLTLQRSHWKYFLSCSKLNRHTVNGQEDLYPSTKKAKRLYLWAREKVGKTLK